MPSQQFYYLNLIHAAICIPLIVLHIYLLTQSVVQKLHDCNRDIYTNCFSIDENSRSKKTSDSLFNDHNDHHSKNNIDWIGLNQYALQISLLFIILFGVSSAFLLKRKLVFIAILFFLLNLVQISLIEISDDRDFPATISRHGNSKRQYAILYLSYATYGALTLKILFLFMLACEFCILIIYFVLIRYDSILPDLLD